MIGYKRELKDVVYLTILQGLNYIAPLIVFPYLMKVLGVEKFGYIGFALSVNQYLMLIVDFGFNLTATKKVALAKNNIEELHKILSSTLWAKTGLLIVSFVMILIMSAIPRFQIYSTTMMILFIMVLANTFSFVWFFQGIGKIRIISTINIISKLLIFPLVFIFVKSYNDVNIAALILSGVYVLTTIITILYLHKIISIKKWFSFTVKAVKEQLKDSYPIFLSSAVATIYTAGYAIILGYVSTPTEVGKYTAVEKIMRGFTLLILVPITQAFYPKISALSVDKKETAKKIINNILIFTLVASIIVCFFMFFYSSFIINIIGKDYSNALPIFRIMSIIPLFIILGGIFGQLGVIGLGGSNKNKKQFKNVYIFASIVAVISLIILVPKNGAVGTSISLLITEFTVFVGMLWVYIKTIK